MRSMGTLYLETMGSVDTNAGSAEEHHNTSSSQSLD